jgi:hypothetical protein
MDQQALARAEIPLIISYFTPGTAYERNADLLRADCARLGLSARIEPRPARPSWVENCAQKVAFIRDMHLEEGRPLLWLDADARLRRRPDIFENLEADLAVVRLDGWALYTGQIYFGAGRGATRLLDLWCDYCTRFPWVWDQVSLGYVWWELSLRDPIEVIWLKQKALYERAARGRLGRLRQAIFRAAPILQLQESRRSKSMQSAAREFATDDLPLWWREAASRDTPFPLDARQLAALGLA